MNTAVVIPARGRSSKSKVRPCAHLKLYEARMVIPKRSLAFETMQRNFCPVSRTGVVILTEDEK
jgi:hypothetical protein